jgi:hypothetical protein
MVSSSYIFCSEVEQELGMLFSKGGGSGVGTKSKYSGSKFSMLVEDVTEGVLVSIVAKHCVIFCAHILGSQPSVLLFNSSG